MKKIICIIIITAISLSALAQGYNSKGGTHRGGNTPYTQQEQQPSYWSGSGIALGNNVFATNNHVVDGATNLYVYFPETQAKYRSTVLTTDTTSDLAIVKITDPDFKGFPAIQYGFKATLEDVGTDVFVLGFPRVDTMGEEVKLTTGVVSSRSGFQGNKSQYQISAPVQPGNSGGPLFNDSGELIGIVSAKHTDGAENVSYAVKLSYLCDLATTCGESIDFSRTTKISSKKLSEQCKAVIPCTVMVVANNERAEASSSERRGNHSNQGRSSTYGTSGSYPIHINMPSMEKTSTNMAGIVGLEIAANGTAIYMAAANQTNEDSWFNIEKGTYIIDKATGKKYFLEGVDGISVSPSKTGLPAGYSAEFTLYFPAIPANVKSIDLCEPSNDGWKFIGILIQ